MGGDILALGIALMMTLALTGINVSLSQYHQRIVLNQGEIGAYEIDGTQWTVIYFSVNSNKPVTVCITDQNGAEKLSSGSRLCMFLVQKTTHVSRIWRFPMRGPLYLLVIPEGNEQVSVDIEIRNLLNTW